MSRRSRRWVEVASLGCGDRVEQIDGTPGGEYVVELISLPFEKLDLFQRKMVGFRGRIVSGPERIGAEGDVTLGPEGHVWRVQVPAVESLSIEIGNEIGRIDGRSCAVGTVYLVRVPGGRTLRTGFANREQAEDFIAKRRGSVRGGEPVTSCRGQRDERQGK